MPEKDAEKLRRAVGDAGGGQIGNYSHTSFSVKGIGRFLPREGASQAIGQVGKLEEVAEERIEITCEREQLNEIVKATRANHPYEEPVIDIYPMLLEG